MHGIKQLDYFFSKNLNKVLHLLVKPFFRNFKIFYNIKKLKTTLSINFNIIILKSTYVS